MRHFKTDTYSELFRKILVEIMENPDYKNKPRDMNVYEIQDAIMELTNPKSNLFINAKRDIPKEYLCGEMLWYFSGRNDLEFISKYSNFWKRIANPDNTLNSAYGYLLFTMRDNPEDISQWEWAYKSLIADKDSRQAVMHFNRPVHQYIGVKDFVCTLQAIFLIRDNKLNMSLMMRSNDVVLGLTFDLPFFTILHQQMHRHLKKTYPELELGTYTHHSISLHIYDRNFKEVEDMLNCEFKEDALPELDIDLINFDGTMTVDFANCFDAVDNKTPFSSKSEFLTYIYSTLIKES